MGQLEKYGLYVLCLVIFLILGVTIWGNPAVAAPGQRNEPVPIRVHVDGTTLGGNQLGGNQLPRDDRSSRNDSLAGGGGVGMIDSLLSPVNVPSPGPKINGREVNKPVNSKPLLGQMLGESGSSGSGRPDVVLQDQETPKSTPAVAATREYKVVSGDTLGGIAQKQLGSTRYVDRIRAANQGLTDKLSIGQVLILPALAASGSAASKTETPAASGLRTYTINDGDTFEDIAKAELGSAGRVQEIIALNRNVDPRRLRPGKKVLLPSK